LRSASISTTSSRRWVTRLPPIRPGIFMPLNTRAGSALAPIEPGARTLCEPWLTGPRWKLWRLIVPWKPLPIATPETLTLCPGSNWSTLATSPTFGPSSAERFLVAELHERAQRRGARLLEVAELTLASFRSATSSKPSWTAA